MIVITTCPICKQKFEHQITEEERQMLVNGEIPDYWPQDVKEHFITGICDDCWNSIDWGEEITE